MKFSYLAAVLCAIFIGTTTAQPRANPVATTAAPTQAPKIAADRTAAALGDGASKVWVNSSTKVYHCEGDRRYGKSKADQYMSESDAKCKIFKGEHGAARSAK